MFETITLDVPDFARLADYSGVWAIESQAGAALLAKARMMNLRLHVEETAAPKRKSEAGSVPVGKQEIGVVMLAGPLMKAVGSMQAGTSTVQARRDIRKLAADPKIDAILLMIDSPGGTVAGTASLAADIKAAAKSKPVWAYADDLCASAAYWLASQADQIFANDRTAMVGSIGTLCVLQDVSKAAEAAGVRTIVIGTGSLKGAGAPGAEITEEQEAYFRGLVEDAQVSFDAAISKGRGLTAKQLSDAKTGGVFGASEALERGLIDGIKSFDAVITDLAAEARKRNRESNQTRVQSPVTRSSKMDETLITPAVETGAVATATSNAIVQQVIISPAAEMRAEAAAESRRIAAIKKHCGANHDLVARAIEGNWTAEKTELESMKADLANGVRSMSQVDLVNGHDKNCTLEALQAGLLLRAGGKLDAACYQSIAALSMKLPQWLRANINDDQRQRYMEAGHKFSQMSMLDLCRESVRLDGKTVPQDRSELIASAVSGGSLTNIFTTNVNARLLFSYMGTPDTSMGWTRTTDVSDFKTQERPRVVIGKGLTPLPRGGEADHAAYSDVAESYKIGRFAKQMFVDEQDMIDDNMQVLSQTPADFGAAAARLRPDLVYYILLSNPTLAATTRALFHATEGNINTTAALAAATIKAAIADMMLFTENGVTLNITPSHLIVPPTLRWTAKELLNSTQIILAGTAGSVTERGNANTLADENLQLVSEARLENGVTDPVTGTAVSGSASTWFLAAIMAHTIEVAYRTGTGRSPQSRSWTSTGKGQWGVGWDINLDIGAKAMDWRGLHKNTA